jgi:hypothetical protein
MAEITPEHTSRRLQPVAMALPARNAEKSWSIPNRVLRS